mmetsp:Transcript_20824/g.43219  ORF Transcript_20824/g.43219 Transcript_20824/m.43219 type:complete len:224 (+) Transcript_20824:3-674(+)
MAAKEPLNGNARGADGLWPQRDCEKMGMGSANLFLVYSVSTFVLGSPGAVAAVAAIFVMPCTAVLNKIALIKSYDLAPLYFILAALQFTMLLINANLGTARRPTRVNVPDQHVYKVYGGAGDSALVLMHDDAEFGKFNRAQRALANFEETLPLLIAQALAMAFIFPWATLVCVVVLGIFRVKGAVDYTTERMKRMTGNMAANALANSFFTANLVIGIAALVKA